ncbi:unnamed protein product [Urochloa humidicola]
MPRPASAAVVSRQGSSGAPLGAGDTASHPADPAPSSRCPVPPPMGNGGVPSHPDPGFDGEQRHHPGRSDAWTADKASGAKQITDLRRGAKQLTDLRRGGKQLTDLTRVRISRGSGCHRRGATVEAGGDAGGSDGGREGTGKQSPWKGMGAASLQGAGG